MVMGHMLTLSGLVIKRDDSADMGNAGTPLRQGLQQGECTHLWPLGGGQAGGKGTVDLMQAWADGGRLHHQEQAHRLLFCAW